jgi:hypothetical protein
LLIKSGKLNTPLMVDTIDNSANKAFAAMPIRLYIIQEGKVQYMGGIGPTFYAITDIKKWMEKTDCRDFNNNNDLGDVNTI